jgi:hypothetical protein
VADINSPIPKKYGCSKMANKTSMIPFKSSISEKNVSPRN